MLSLQNAKALLSLFCWMSCYVCCNRYIGLGEGLLGDWFGLVMAWECPPRLPVLKCNLRCEVRRGWKVNLTMVLGAGFGKWLGLNRFIEWSPRIEYLWLCRKREGPEDIHPWHTHVSYLLPCGCPLPPWDCANHQAIMRCSFSNLAQKHEPDYTLLYKYLTSGILV